MSLSHRVPDLGDARDNLAAYDVAMAALARGEVGWALRVLRLIVSHVEHTGEIASMVHVLPMVLAAIGRHETDPEFAALTSQPKEPLGLVLGETARHAKARLLADLVTACPQQFLQRFIVCDEATYRLVFWPPARDATETAEGHLVGEPRRWRTIGGKRPTGMVFRRIEDSGASQLCEMISQRAVRTVIFLPNSTDLEGSSARIILRAAMIADVELFMTLRSIADTFIGNVATFPGRSALRDEGLAIIAHPEKKHDCMVWVIANAARIVECRHIFATESTGDLIKEYLRALGLSDEKVLCVPSGPVIGDESIVSQIARNRVQHVVFFPDPMWAAPHDAAVIELLKACVSPEFSVNLCLNPKSATSWAQALAKSA